MKGKPGKFVVFDGSKIFHRGGCIDKGQRLVLQLTFGEKIITFKKSLRKKYLEYLKINEQNKICIKNLRDYFFNDKLFQVIKFKYQ